MQHLRTPGGAVRARRMAVCTGGYTGQLLNPLLKNRLMPILSNSVVTRPLTEAEPKATNFRKQIFLTDARTLRFCYRLLDGHQLQIGSRSAIAGRDAGREVFQLPIYDTPLQPPNLFGAMRSPAFAPFRRLGRRLLYRWYARQDEAT